MNASSPDISSARVWATVTIQTAWTLQTAGVRCTPALLHEVRRHVLLSLPPGVGEDFADARTPGYVREFLGRFRDRDYQQTPATNPPRPVRSLWRDALLEGLDPVGMVVWRLVYGDGLPLSVVEARCSVDRVVLASACDGLRCALRSLVGEALEADALDALLVRLARLPSPDCDGGAGALAAPREHIERCPRCCRALRLARASLLRASDLAAPTGGWTTERISVLALNLHPDGRQHRGALLETFGGAALGVAEDMVVVDLERAANHVSVLHALAEEGTPSRHHVRGALVRGPGRWHERGLIGPVARHALGETRARQWGEIDTVGTLPEVLPPPPSATPWWGAAALTAMTAALVGATALKPLEEPPVFSLEEVTFQRSEGIVSGRFDVDDRAYALVVLDGPDGLDVLNAGDSPADKGALATGEGDFEVSAGGRQLLLAVSPEPFDGIEELTATVRAAPRPLEELAQRLDALHDKRAHLVIQPLPEPS